MRKKHKRLKKFLFILFCLILLFVVYVIIGESMLTVGQYTFESKKIETPFRVVAIADLHNKEFGENNHRLMEKIKEQNPDMIAVLGDMNIRRDANTDSMMHTLTGLTDIAPVYYCLGNHEREAMQTVRPKITEEIKQTGVNLLDSTVEDIEVNGQTITIAGLTYKAGEIERYNGVVSKLEEKNKQNFTLLLCHYPEYYIWWLSKNDFDLMLSGHAHGGLVRIPFVGGMIAPEQGLWPKYTEGMVNLEGKSTLLITRGLWRSYPVPRINNPPEIVVLDVVNQ